MNLSLRFDFTDPTGVASGLGGEASRRKCLAGTSEAPIVEIRSQLVCVFDDLDRIV